MAKERKPAKSKLSDKEAERNAWVKEATSNIKPGKTMIDVNNDPVFKKKKENAKAFLEKSGLLNKINSGKFPR